MLVKICGLTHLEDAKMAIDAGADLLGFIFHTSSRRAITPETFLSIQKNLKEAQDKMVGVFLDEPIQQIAKTIKLLGLKWVQCLAPKRQEELSPLGDVQKILVFRVQEQGDYEPASYKHPKGYWLYDGAKVGSGNQFNWEDFVQKESGAFFIAGGLKESNLKQAFDRFHPDGVDVASGVCLPDGVRKDPQKVKAFIEKAHALSKSQPH